MKKKFNDVAGVNAYHIHIYFEQGKDSMVKAKKIAIEMNRKFSSAIAYLSPIGPIGPHTLPNYAVHIKKDSFADIVPWIQFNSQGLSVLIHPDTGDDRVDHLDRSMWLGTPVAYNDRFFARLP